MNAKMLPTPSLVLEWETVEEGGIERAIRGLRAINEQITELRHEFSSTPEVIVCFERHVTTEDELRSIFDRAAGPDGWTANLHTIPVPDGTHYYEKKNIGARSSVNEVIVFIDTDLVADPGWLRNLLTAFNSWTVSVMLGATHLDHVSLYEMAMALCWIFPPATHGRGIQPLRRYSSNNLAFRRALFLRFPFPTLPTYRGQCGELGQTLLNVGITVQEHTDARATHPPPPGVFGFIHRAWAAGKDAEFYKGLEEDTSLRTLADTVRYDYGVVARRMRERREILRPGLAALTLGWLLGWAYYGIKAAGYLSGLLRRSASEAGSPSAAGAKVT
jgi:hypothetical protein